MQELEAEVKDKLFFGCILGMFILPIILAQEGEYINFDNFATEEAQKKFFEDQQRCLKSMTNKEGPLRDRFLAIFDDVDLENINLD